MTLKLDGGGEIMIYFQVDSYLVEDTNLGIFNSR